MPPLRGKWELDNCADFCKLTLALALRVALRERLDAKGWKLEWNDIVRDLSQLQEVVIRVQDKGYILRTQTQGAAGKVAQACGITLPPALRKA